MFAENKQPNASMVKTTSQLLSVSLVYAPKMISSATLVSLGLKVVLLLVTWSNQIKLQNKRNILLKRGKPNSAMSLDTMKFLQGIVRFRVTFAMVE
jgi:hypothetical protein